MLLFPECVTWQRCYSMNTSHISLFSVLRRGNVSKHSKPIMQIYQVCHVCVKNSCLYRCRDKRLLCSVLSPTAPKGRASRWLVNLCRCVNGLTFCTSRLQKAPRLWHDAEFKRCLAICRCHCFVASLCVLCSACVFSSLFLEATLKRK